MEYRELDARRRVMSLVYTGTGPYVACNTRGLVHWELADTARGAATYIHTYYIIQYLHWTPPPPRVHSTLTVTHLFTNAHLAFDLQ